MFRAMISRIASSESRSWFAVQTVFLPLLGQKMGLCDLQLLLHRCSCPFDDLHAVQKGARMVSVVLAVVIKSTSDKSKGNLQVWSRT